MLMIHNTKTQKEIGKLTKIKSGNVIKLMKETFGQKPNIANLKEFFRNEIVQKLWWGQNGFSKSEDLKKILQDLSVLER